MATLVELAAEVYAEIGPVAPSSIAGNSENEAIQLKQFLNATGKELLSKHGWQVLHREVTFTTIAGDQQLNMRTSFPSFDRVVPETFVNRTLAMRIRGPVSAPRHQAHMALPIRYWRQWRIRGTHLYIVGNDSSGHVIGFEYITRDWVVASDGTEKPAFTSDTDECLFNDRAMVLGAKWRVLRQMGLEYNSARDEYERYVRLLIARDVPHERLSLDGGGRGCDDIEDGIVAGAFGDYVESSETPVINFTDDLVWQPPGDPDVDGYEIDWS